MAKLHDDLTLLSVRSAFEHLQSTVNRALQRIERQEQLNNAALFNEVKERRKLAKVLLLDQKLIQLYAQLTEKAALELHPSDSIIHAELSSSIVTRDAEQTKVRFLINRTEYALVLADVGGACISYYGETFNSAHLSLRDEQGNNLMTVHLDLTGDIAESQVSESQITAFVPGKWIYDVIHAHETLVINKKLEAINDAFSEEKIALLKQRYGID